MDEPFGIDVSRYQGKIDWDVIADYEPRVVFAGIRATINEGYTDNWFSRNWLESKRVGIARTAYHIVFPETPVENQIGHFLRVVGDDCGELPLTLDLELDHGTPQPRIAELVFRCSAFIEKRTGRKPILYSRTDWVDAHIIGIGKTPPAWLNEHDWWIALHVDEGGESVQVEMPESVSIDRLKIHQYTDRGKPIGVGSDFMHYNCWQGSYEDFVTYIHGPGTRFGDVDIDLEYRLARLEAEARKHGWSL